MVTLGRAVTGPAGPAGPSVREGRSNGYADIPATAENARHTGGALAVADVLASAHYGLLGPDGGALRQQIAEALIAESARTFRQGDALSGLFLCAVNLILEGDRRALRLLTELREMLAVHDEKSVRHLLSVIDVMFEIRAGRFPRAEQLAVECVAFGRKVESAYASTWYMSHLVAIRWYQGRVAELLPTLRLLAAAADIGPSHASLHSALAVAAAGAGHRDEALNALAVLGCRTLRDLPRSGSWLVAVYGVVEAALLLGEGDLAAQAYELLLPYASLPILAGPAVSCFGSVEYALGVARLAVGAYDGAVEHLRRAVAHNTALGHFPAAVLARHRLAAALVGSGRADQLALARTEAAVARREAAELGMQLPGPIGGGAVRLASSGFVPVPVVPTCRRRGRDWEIGALGRTIHVNHCRGIAYLAILLANPGREITALELATAADSKRAVGGDGTPLELDDEATRRLRERLSELQSEIDACDVTGEQDRAIRVHAERELLLARLRSAAGIDGSPSGPDDREAAEERARIAVGKAIRRALARIAEADAELGQAFNFSVYTGRACVYIPVRG